MYDTSNFYKDILDDDVAFVNMSIRESKWRQIAKNIFESRVQGISAKIFEPNISVIFQRIFVKFKMQIF
jgi:hypothetical protein